MNEVNNENVEIKKGSRDSKKITIVLVLVLTLMITTTSATYAWLAISATSNANNITGIVASGGLAFQLSNSSNTSSGIPSLSLPSSTYASKPMIPQYGYNSGNVLQAAVTANCVDGNSNVVCRAYTFTIRNNATASVKVNGRIYFSGAPTNLRWALMSNASTVSISGTTPATNFRVPQTSANCTASTATTGDNANNCWFALNKSLVPSGGASSTSAASGSYQQYWLVFWINETGGVQTDSGTWNATIEFTSSDGKGITSTITGS